MIGLDYLAAGYLQMASLDLKCQLKQTPRITVSASNADIVYDHSRDQRQLDRLQTDTISPYSKGIESHVGGMMNGEVTISQNSQVMKESFPTFNAGCLYVSSIAVEIRINPKIFIAKEYPKGSCLYNSVMEHEQKHVRVDQLVVGKYVGIITDALKNRLKTINYTIGPLPLGQINEAQQDLQTTIQGTIKQYSNRMTAERKQKQQEVDTLQEYERVKSVCRGRPL